MLTELDRVDILTGVSQASLATNEKIIARIKAGQVIDYSPTSVMLINSERIITAMPSALMVTGTANPTYAAVRNAGVPVVANVEWLENTALGRAEWIKYLALFLNEENKAQQVFDAVRNNYFSLAERTRSIPEKARPKVMTGAAFRGRFTVAGGRSYVARLIGDAGGQYLWSDNKDTGTIPVEIETALSKAGDADIWINGGEWRSLTTMLADDSRYTEFKAYRNGQVWLYNRRVNENGGNEYWGRGVTRPDLVLADLIKIFHPALARDHEFEWYAQVPAK
jgi:iron complex transport system substrate-binding protein